MPRPAIDLETHKDLIVHLIWDKGYTNKRVMQHLQDELDLTVARGTLQRRLTDWDISTQPKIQDSEELRARITSLFYESKAADAEVVDILEDEGFQVTLRGLRGLRKKMGLQKHKKRHRSASSELGLTLSHEDAAPIPPPPPAKKPKKPLPKQSGTSLPRPSRSSTKTSARMLHHHPSTAPTSLLAALRPHLPTSLPLYRRIQFAHTTPDSHILCSLSPAECETRASGARPWDTTPWIAAFVDRSKRPETEVWVFGSWEKNTTEDEVGTSNGESESWQKDAAPLMASLVREIAAIGLSDEAATFAVQETTSLQTPPSTTSAPNGHKSKSKSTNKKPPRSTAPAPAPASTPATHPSATLITSSDYTNYLSNPAIVLFGAVHASTVRLLNSLDLIPPGFVGSDIPYRKYAFDLPLSLPPSPPQPPPPNDASAVTQTLPQPQPHLLPHGLRWGKVHPAHFALVRARTAIPRQDRTLAQLPSVAVFAASAGGDADDAATVPVAWAFLGPDASLTTLHVEAEYRGLGLAKAVTVKLFDDEMHVFTTNGGDEVGRARGRARWAHADVAVDNEASNGVCCSLGGRCIYLDYWVRVDVSKA